jgi:hypothetical protein
MVEANVKGRATDGPRGTVAGKEACDVLTMSIIFQWH